LVTVHRETGSPRNVAGRDAGPNITPVGPASVPVTKCPGNTYDFLFRSLRVSCAGKFYFKHTKEVPDEI
jgi:hypothetical protein